MMRALFLLGVLAAITYGVVLAVRWFLERRAERVRARSKWTVETRKAHLRAGVTTIKMDEPGTSPPAAWAVVLRRPGEEQVYRIVPVGMPEALLDAQAEAEAEATALNEGRRR